MQPLLPWKSHNYYIFLCVWGAGGVHGHVLAHVALLIQYATPMRHTVFDLWLHHIYLHYRINGTIFGEKSC
jgi:hypothetical protein